MSFSKKFEDENESSNRKEEWVVKPDYPLHCAKPNVGFHHCASAGTYTLVWDNSQSRFMSRTLKYHVMLSQDVADEQSNGSSTSIDSVEL